VLSPFPALCAPRAVVGFPTNNAAHVLHGSAVGFPTSTAARGSELCLPGTCPWRPRLVGAQLDWLWQLILQGSLHQHTKTPIHARQTTLCFTLSLSHTHTHTSKYISPCVPHATVGLLTNNTPHILHSSAVSGFPTSTVVHGNEPCVPGACPQCTRPTMGKLASTCIHTLRGP